MASPGTLTTQRICPLCRLRTPLLHCAHDGTATFCIESAMLSGTGRLAAGTLVAGRYRIMGRIGRGGMGLVYEAEHTGSGQRVAVKVLTAELGGEDLDPLFRFHREARIIAALKHPNTVRLYDFGQCETGALFMVMELLRGPTLRQWLARRADDGEALSPPETVAIGLALLRSLGEAHQAGLVHRDIKPDNVVLATSDDGEVLVKVLDFGVARTDGSLLTRRAAMVGTPAFMSPEQCLGRAVDARSDLYAVGVVLYWCLTGLTPFRGDAAAQIRGHCGGTPPDLRPLCREPVPDALVQLVGRALAKDPADRFANAAEMREALLSSVAGAAKLTAESLGLAEFYQPAPDLYSEIADGEDDFADGEPAADQWGATALDQPGSATAAAVTALHATQSAGPPPVILANPAGVAAQKPGLAQGPAPRRRIALAGLGLTAMTCAAAAAGWWWHAPKEPAATLHRPLPAAVAEGGAPAKGAAAPSEGAMASAPSNAAQRPVAVVKPQPANALPPLVAAPAASVDPVLPMPVPKRRKGQREPAHRPRPAPRAPVIEEIR